MPHTAVEIDRLTRPEHQRRVTLGVQFEFAVQHEQKLLAVVPHQWAELLECLRPVLAQNRRHLLIQRSLLRYRSVWFDIGTISPSGIRLTLRRPGCSDDTSAGASDNSWLRSMDRPWPSLNNMSYVGEIWSFSIRDSVDGGMPVRLAISAKVHRLRLRKFFNAVPGLAVDMCSFRHDACWLHASRLADGLNNTLGRPMAQSRCIYAIQPAMPKPPLP